jgi:hypothetical protein
MMRSWSARRAWHAPRVARRIGVGAISEQQPKKSRRSTAGNARARQTTGAHVRRCAGATQASTSTTRSGITEHRAQLRQGSGIESVPVAARRPSAIDTCPPLRPVGGRSSGGGTTDPSHPRLARLGRRRRSSPSSPWKTLKRRPTRRGSARVHANHGYAPASTTPGGMRR